MMISDISLNNRLESNSQYWSLVWLTLKEVLLCVHVRIVSDDVERGPSSHHLKHQHAQSPPVHAEAWEEHHIQTGCDMWSISYKQRSGLCGVWYATWLCTCTDPQHTAVWADWHTANVRKGFKDTENVTHAGVTAVSHTCMFLWCYLMRSHRSTSAPIKHFHMYNMKCC